MAERDDPREAILTAFGRNSYPGDRWLVGSTDGDEPYDEVLPFRGRTDWRALEPPFLDMHAGALSFFSEAAFRFFLPAYLLADLDGALLHAEPVFHLTHGLYDAQVRVPLNGREIIRSIGGSALVNPLRYGAMTFYDYHRYRHSIFTREEAAAIVAYLVAVRDRDPGACENVDAALDGYWRERAATAPVADTLVQHDRAMQAIAGPPPPPTEG